MRHGSLVFACRLKTKNYSPKIIPFQRLWLCASLPSIDLVIVTFMGYFCIVCNNWSHYFNWSDSATIHAPCIETKVWWFFLNWVIHLEEFPPRMVVEFISLWRMIQYKEFSQVCTVFRMMIVLSWMIHQEVLSINSLASKVCILSQKMLSVDKTFESFFEVCIVCGILFHYLTQKFLSR